MDIVLNQIALWRPCGSSKLDKRLSPIGVKYRTASSGVYQSAESPLIRYCKDYQLKKDKTTVDFCLFVRTDVDNDPMIEAQLDSVAKALDLDEILKATANSTIENFTYLPNLIKEAQ